LYSWQRNADIPAGRSVTVFLLAYQHRCAQHVQEVTFLRVGEFFPVAFHLLAPVKNLFILGVHFVSVNGVYHQFGVLFFQVFQHRVSSVEHMPDARPGGTA